LRCNNLNLPNLKLKEGWVVEKQYWMEIKMSNHKSILKNTMNQIDELCTMECEVINEAFRISEKRGLLHLKDAIHSFEAHLVSSSGPFVKGMSIEYRGFIISILSKIEPKFLPASIKEVLFPSSLESRQPLTLDETETL